jgi:hypothetical protein
MKAVIFGLAMLASTQSAPTIRAGDLTQNDVALIVSRVPRLFIDRFSVLPPSVRDAFSQMNCQVPQATLAAPANVIQGEFAVRGQRDWAALCSDGTWTELRIVWGGPEGCEDRLAVTPDVETLVPTAPSVYAYARRIESASEAQLRRMATRHGVALPPGPEHDAIEDTVDGAMLTWYCAGGDWLRVP